MILVVLVIGAYFLYESPHSSTTKFGPVIPRSSLSKIVEIELRNLKLKKGNDGKWFVFDKKLYNEAESEIQNLIIKYKNDENLYNIHGAILSRLQIFDKANEKYQKALELNPSFPEALNNLAELKNQTKEFNEAKQLCEKAIKLNKNYAEAYNNLGNSLIQVEIFPAPIPITIFFP